MPYATKSQIERARQPDLLTFLRGRADSHRPKRI